MNVDMTRGRSTPQAEARAASRAGDAWLVALSILALLLISAVPYWFAEWSAARAGVHFTGIVVNLPDNMQYWSWMRDHREALLIPNRQTSEPNDPALFNVLWLILGQIERATGWSEPAMHQLLRWVGSAAFLAVLWWFIGMLTPRRGERWAAFGLISLGGGLGWIWVVEKYLSGRADMLFPFHLHVSEANTFFNMLAFPHFLVAAALILVVFGCYLRGEGGAGWGWYALATAAALFLGVQHAYDLIMVYAILGAYTLLRFAQARRVRWGPFWGLGALGFISFPPAAYFLYITTQNPLWREVLDQFSNAGVFTPGPLGLLVLLGVPFIVTIGYGAALLRRGAWRAAFAPGAGERPAPALFLWTWAVVGFALLYIPADFQIHMLNPYQVPLGILAVQAALAWAGSGRAPAGASALARRLRSFPALALLLIVASAPVTAYLWGWRMLDMRALERPHFLSLDEVASLEWLEARDGERAVVLSGLEYGQFIPALTSHRAVIAHWAMTAHFYEREADVRRFFDPATPAADRAALLGRLGVAYVVHGPSERALGAYDPAADPALELAYAGPEVQIYRVR